MKYKILLFTSKIKKDYIFMTPLEVHYKQLSTGSIEMPFEKIP